MSVNIKKCHKRLFVYIAEKIPKLVFKKSAIDTDREKALSNAIGKL